MSYDKVKQAKARTVGTKQTKKAIEQGKVLEVYIAKDADQHVTEWADHNVPRSQHYHPVC